MRFDPTVVIYHASCYDGFTAAWLLHQEFPEARYVPWGYGEKHDLSETEGGRVLMVDFSLPREEMLELERLAEVFFCLDHHKTAEAALEGLDFCEFDMERSGCQMAWDWLRPGETRPWLVDRVADRDLWRFEHPVETPRVHAFLSSLPMTWDSWDGARLMARQDVLSAGAAVMGAIDRYCEKVTLASARIRSSIHGEAIVANAPYLNSSELCSYMLEQAGDEAEFAVVWFQRADGSIQYSLRSRGDFDVSEVAKAYGGGGHKNAAGFTSDGPIELWA